MPYVWELKELFLPSYSGIGNNRQETLNSQEQYRTKRAPGSEIRGDLQANSSWTKC